MSPQLTLILKLSVTTSILIFPKSFLILAFSTLFILISPADSFILTLFALFIFISPYSLLIVASLILFISIFPNCSSTFKSLETDFILILPYLFFIFIGFSKSLGIYTTILGIIAFTQKNLHFLILVDFISKFLSNWTFTSFLLEYTTTFNLSPISRVF